MSHYGNIRKGSTLTTALIISFCTLIVLGAIVFRQTNTSPHNQLTILDKQAFFAARSAMQHFLLKAKLFPTELYDAVEISQGKNPLFSFTEYSIENQNGRDAFEEYPLRPNLYIRKGNPQELPEEFDQAGKSKYYYIKLPNRNNFIRLASYHNPAYRFLAPNLAKDSQNLKYTEPNEPNSTYNASKYLTYYFRDCTNHSVNNKILQPTLETIIANGIKNINNFDIAVEDGYPYTLNYSVSDIKIKTIQGMKKYDEETIEITVEGSAIDFLKKKKTQKIAHTHTITRKGSI